MRLRLLCLFLIIALINASPTILSYIIEVEDEERQDFLQMTIKVEGEDSSLTSAMAIAREKATQIKNNVQEICKKVIKKKSDCKQMVQIGKVDIEPSYKEQKKQTLYEKMKVAYDVIVTIKETSSIGSLVDETLKVEGIVIDSIKWVADQEAEDTPFLQESLQKSQQMCSQINKKFIKVISVEQLRPQPEEPQQEQPKEEQQQQQQEQEQPEQQPQQQQQETTSYRITIECDGISKKKQKK